MGMDPQKASMGQNALLAPPHDKYNVSFFQDIG
jgi:hypothetical protein